MFFVVIIEENRIYVDEKGKPYKTAGKIDYVAGWYYKAAKLMQNTPIHTAFVSTNSITQGEQVAGVWKPLYDQFGIHIDFAHRTFRWDSEANAKAYVHMPRKPLYCSTLHGFKIRRGTTKKGRSAAPTKAFAQRFYPLERLIFSESVVRLWYTSKGKRKSPQFLTNFR